MNFMDKSVQQGMDELAQNPGKTYTFDCGSGFNLATSVNQEAAELTKALHRGSGHSGSTFGFALKGVFAKSVTAGNRDLRVENEAGEVVCQSRDMTTLNNAVGRMFGAGKGFTISIMPVVK